MKDLNANPYRYHRPDDYAKHPEDHQVNGRREIHSDAYIGKASRPAYVCKEGERIEYPINAGAPVFVVPDWWKPGDSMDYVENWNTNGNALRPKAEDLVDAHWMRCPLYDDNDPVYDDQGKQKPNKYVYVLRPL